MEIMHNESTWPPAYNLRLSKKARHVHLKIIPNKGLEVVVPARQHKRIAVTDLLLEKKAWIEKHLASLIIQPLQPINSLELRAINQSWKIEYQQTVSTQIRGIMRPGTDVHTLVLYGDIKDPLKVQRWLKDWLKKLAKQHLLPWLRALSVAHDLSYNKDSVRGQQTLWGSCTAEKNISLNYKLLFIPHNYAQHIMLHELCHTKHLNHSNRFWNLLTKLDADCMRHNREIRESEHYVPIFFN